MSNNWTFPPLFPILVIATMRDLKKKDKLVEAAGDAYGKTLALLPLDVCSDESVKQCISSVKDRHIDILSEFLLSFLKEWICRRLQIFLVIVPCSF